MKRIVRENVALALALLVVTPIAGVWAMRAFGIGRVLSFLTACVVLVAIWTVAKDLDRKLTRGDDDA